MTQIVHSVIIYLPSCHLKPICFFSLSGTEMWKMKGCESLQLENVISELNGTELVSVNLQWIIRTSFMNLKEQFIGKFGLKSMIELNITLCKLKKSTNHSDQFYEFDKIDR